MWAWLLSLIGLGQDADDTGASEAVDLFIRYGLSVPAISARLYPGVGGPALLDRQRDIEDEIREYIGELAETIAELKEQVAELQEA